MWADEIVIHNHASTDGTAQIIEDLHQEFPDRVVSWWTMDPTWKEMAHRQKMLDLARENGATHIAYIDDDEVVTGDLVPAMRTLIRRLPVGEMLELPWLCLRGSLSWVHNTGLWGDSYVSTAFLDMPLCLRWEASGPEKYDFHQRRPLGYSWIDHRPIAGRSSGLMHLQFVNERRLRAKQALYQMIEVLRWPTRKSPHEVAAPYQRTVAHHLNAPGSGAQVPAYWWEAYSDLMPHLDVNSEPWQEIECKRLVSEYGRAKFSGLDLFGVV